MAEVTPPVKAPEKTPEKRGPEPEAPKVDGSNSDVVAAAPPLPPVGDITQGVATPLLNSVDPQGKVVDPAGKWADLQKKAGNGNRSDVRIADRIGSTPITIDGQGTVQLNRGDFSVSIGDGVFGVGGPRDMGIKGTYKNSRTFNEHSRDGEVVGTSSRHQLTRGGDLTVSPTAKTRISRSVSHEAVASAFAGKREDGTLVDQGTLDKRIAAVADRNATGPRAGDEVDGLIAELQTWQKGDSVGTDTLRKTSMDVGVAGLVGGSVGGGDKERTQRTVEALGDGKVRITVTDYESLTGKAGLSGGFGVLGANGEVEAGNAKSQSVDFDLKTDAGKRDFAIMQYSGLLPGAASKLGIKTPEEAKAFIAAGGWKAVEEGTWKGADPSLAGKTKEEVNASLREAGTAKEGFVTKSDADIRRTSAKLSLLGFDAARVENGSEHATEKSYGPDGERTVIRTKGTHERGGFLFEDGKSRSELAIDDQGRFVMRHSSTFDAAMDGTGGPLVDRMKANEKLGGAVTDPTARTTLSGTTADLLAGIRKSGAETSDATRRLALADTNRFGDNEAILGKGGRAALERAAKEAGVSVADLLATTRSELVAAQEGEKFDVSKLSPEAAKAYAILSVSAVGGGGFDVLHDIAKTSPEVATQAIAAAISASGPDGILKFEAWAKAHPDIAASLTIDKEALAGSSAAAAIIAAKAKPDQKAADRLVADITALAQNPDDLELFLDGVNTTSASQDKGGLERIFEKLPPGKAGEIIAAAGDHPAVAALAKSYGTSRPDLVIPQGLSTEDQKAWAEKHLAKHLPEGTDIGALVTKGQELAHATGVDRTVLDAFVQIAGREKGNITGLFDGLEPEQSRDMLKWLGGNGLQNMQRMFHLAQQRGEAPHTLMKRLFETKDRILREFILSGMESAPLEADPDGKDHGTRLSNEMLRTAPELGRRGNMSDADYRRYLEMRRQGIHDRARSS